MAQTALQVASSATGGLSTAAKLDRSNRWAIVGGPHSVGRFTTASTRHLAAATSASPGEKGDDEGRPDDQDALVGVVADTGEYGAEIDAQLGQLTLKSKHLQALTGPVANHPDVKMIFGDATMQTSVLERTEQRAIYRLVGLAHDLEHWPGQHSELPPVPVPFFSAPVSFIDTSAFLVPPFSNSHPCALSHWCFTGMV